MCQMHVWIGLMCVCVCVQNNLSKNPLIRLELGTQRVEAGQRVECLKPSHPHVKTLDTCSSKISSSHKGDIHMIPKPDLDGNSIFTLYLVHSVEAYFSQGNHSLRAFAPTPVDTLFCTHNLILEEDKMVIFCIQKSWSQFSH